MIRRTLRKRWCPPIAAPRPAPLAAAASAALLHKPAPAVPLQAAFVLVRLLWRGSTAGKALYAGLVLTTVLYAACYRSIAGALGELPSLANG